MNLSGLLPQIQEALAAAREAIGNGRRLTLGLPDAAKPAALAALLADRAAPALIVVSRADRAQALAEELAAWLGQPERILPFPERDPLPYERLAPDPEAVRDRLRVLSLLAAGQGTPIVIASAKALAQRTLSREELKEGRRAVAPGQQLEPEGLLTDLMALGYTVEPLVERPGQVCRRGGIIDVFPPQAELPARIELVGRRVESLRLFDPASQRSLRSADSAVLGPAREAVLPSTKALARALDPTSCSAKVRQRFQDDRTHLASGLDFPGAYFYLPFLAQATLIHHLPSSAVLVCDESADLTAVMEELTEQAEASRAELEERGDIPTGLPLPYAPWREVTEAIESHGRRLYLSRWASDEEADTLRLPFGPTEAYGGQLRRLATEVGTAIRQGRRIAIVSQQAKRLSELLSDQDLPAEAESDVATAPRELCLAQGSLSSGWRLREDGIDLALITDTEIFGFTKQRRAQPSRRATVSREAFLAQLSPNDYVVHIEHGIGRFAGLVRLDIEGRQREYLELHYTEGDRLFVPTDQLDRVSRYVGPGDHQPRLTRLGSGDWQRAKARVRRAVHDLAQELLALYAAREVITGHGCSPDTPWQLELEASFPYLETADQLAAIAEVKRDMERARPMDRLVCGDVGYGKTEVAVRAAFKTAMDGKQVALLVPTTVLAQQHHQTFSQRLAAFPLRVEMLSRFRSEAEQRHIIEGLAAGTVDIVIGTHRLLQRDVRFKDLGLVIIDEEQRFGVAHKERFKSMRKEVDVLTLSATPIPRTLYMALGGIRDMSAMETPPEERLPIKTYVSEFDERLVREAVIRELERGGQVYFVHNRVQSIKNVAHKLGKTVPEASIAIAHGQMSESELERTMAEFAAGRVDMLVCTTIIESGLDIPNVNTIIINQADKLGLAQLYQLRGRVGRGAHRAYAYLLYDRKARLTETAEKRLETIFQATELGAGLQIALRDLEIRGAGNLLGNEQSGQMAAVGFDLYCRLLAEAVERLRAMMRGEPPPPPREVGVTIDLPVSAHIPESYVPDLNLRLALYQRLTEAQSPEEVQVIEQELIDRFGPPPTAVRSLLEIVRLRALAIVAGVRSIATEEGQIVVRLKEGRTLPALGDRLPGGVHPGRTLIRIDVGDEGRPWEQALQEVLEALAGRAAAV